MHWLTSGRTNRGIVGAMTEVIRAGHPAQVEALERLVVDKSRQLEHLRRSRCGYAPLLIPSQLAACREACVDACGGALVVGLAVQQGVSAARGGRGAGGVPA